MDITWNPRLVKIPVPIMLAITMDTAVDMPNLIFIGVNHGYKSNRNYFFLLKSILFFCNK